VAHKDTLLLALDALLADGPSGFAFQHLFACHEHTECGDGCDDHGDPARVTALDIAERVLLPVALADPFQCGEHLTLPTWCVQQQITRHDGLVAWYGIPAHHEQRDTCDEEYLD